MNKALASDIIDSFSDMKFVLYSDNKTSADYRYDDVFNEKTLPTYMDFASYYSSTNSFAIPGLENTNMLGNECDTMVPQAICFAGDYMLISAYDGKEKYEEDASLCIERDIYNSVMYVLSNNNSDSYYYLTTLVLPCKSHVGGMAFDGTNIWISNGESKISSISYTDVQNAVATNEDSIAVEFDKIVNVDIVPSFLTFYDNMLWIGTFDENKKGAFNAYDAYKLGSAEVAVPIYYSHVPAKTQGAVFKEINEKTYLVLSRSLGRNSEKNGYVSQIEFYEPDFSSTYTKIQKSQKTIVAPPMIEGIAICGNYMYCCFESASTLYSTIEGNLCETPTDRICALDISMLFSYLKDYKQESDVKYTDLFFGYPYYLNNNIESTYASMIVEQYTSVLNSYDGFDTFLSALRTGYEEGIDVYIKAIGGALGLTDSFYYECLDKATLELMKTIYESETDFSKYVSSTSDDYKTMKYWVDAGNVLTTSVIAKTVKNLSSSQIETISKTLDDNIDSVLDKVEDMVEVWKFIATACLIEDIKLEYINSLIDVLPENSLLLEGLKRLKQDIYVENFNLYVGKQFANREYLKTISDWIEDNYIWTNDNLKFEKLIADLIFKALDWVIFENITPLGSGEEVIIDTILSTYVTDLETAIISQKLKFYKCFYTSDIFDYQIIYFTYISAIKTTLQYSKKLAKNSTQEETLNNAYVSVCNNYTYENYIRLCKNSVTNTPYDERIIKDANMEETYNVNSKDFSIGYPCDELDLEHSIYLFNNELFYGLKIGDAGFDFDKSMKLPQIIGAPTGRDTNELITILPEINIITDQFLNQHYNESHQSLKIIIEGDLIVNGDFSIKGNGLVWSHQMMVDVYGSLEVNGNLDLTDYANLHMYNSRLVVEGDFVTKGGTKYSPKLRMYGDNSTIICKGDFAPFLGLFVSANSTYTESLHGGKIYLYGDLTSALYSSGTNYLILCGESKQTICGSTKWTMQNLININTSYEGISLSSDIKISGEYHSPIQKINCGEHYVKLGSNATLYPGDYYSSVYLENNYTFKNDVTIDGNLYSSGSSRIITITEDATIIVNGNISSSSNTKNSYYINNGILIVNGDFKVSGLSMTQPNSALTVHGKTDISYNKNYLISNGTIYAYGDIDNIKASGSNTVVLCGTEKQIIKNYPEYANLIVNNTSEEGIEFTSTVKVNILFNHKGNSFTLYNNGTGSTFVDFDGDGMKDNVDPEPTIGNSCTITVKTENEQKGIVSENFDTIGGTTVTVTAEPTFKYDFYCWKDANGNIVSKNAKYTFIAKGDTTLTAYFTKRHRNIVVQVENGTLSVPISAEIDSTVTVVPVENDGYVFTENSITVNDVVIDGNTFVMPDEDVLISAEFIKNDYYFALKDALTEAEAIDRTLYSSETVAALNVAINNAESSLVNNITKEESDARITEIETATNNLIPLNGVCGDNLSWSYDESTKTLTITGTGAMYDYTATTRPWEAFEDDMTRVILGDEVTYIGRLAFYHSSTLTTVDMGGVTTIGTNAFSHCTGLKNVEIGSKVTTINLGAFNGCTALESVIIPESVTTIGNTAFYNCKVLTDVYYKGIQNEWDVISIGINNDYLTSATLHCHTHNFIGAVTTKQTCTKDGVMTYSCNCGDISHTEIVPADGHNIGEWESTTSPTCTESGEQAKKCTVCGEVLETEEVSPSGHNYELSVIEPTCLEAGEQAQKCTICGDKVEVVEIPATGHNYEAVVTAPTCTQNGYTTYMCSACGDSYVADETSSLGHREADAVTENLIKETCLEDGSYDSVVYCLICSAELERTTNAIPSLGGHTESDWEITHEPTCVVSGEQVKKCKVCDDVLITEDISAKGHTEVEWRVGIKPTCTKTGLQSKFCLICNAVLENEKMPATGHTASGWQTTISPTCTSVGKQVKKCTVCGSIFKTQEIAMTEHISGAWITIVEPTCTLVGEKVKECINCQAVVETVDIPATGMHTIGDWEITIEPTTESVGESTKKCTVCGNVLESKEIPILTETSGFCGNDLLWNYDTETKTLTITGTGAMFDYTATTRPWEAFEDEMTTVILGDEVTYIGRLAFYHSSTLTTVDIGGVNTIGINAFSYCIGLKNFEIGKNVTTINLGAFNGCTALESVIIPESVTTIGNTVFNNCKSLTDVYYKSSEDEWNLISIGINNTYLISATIHFYFENYVIFIDEDMHVEGIIYELNSVLDFKNRINKADIYVEVSDISGIQLNEADLVGTGTTVYIYDSATNELLDTYTVVLYGDVDGDGLINDADKEIITNVAICQATIDNKWCFMAADTNHDGTVDGFDVIETELQALDMHNIEQKNDSAYLPKDEEDESKPSIDEEDPDGDGWW